MEIVSMTENQLGDCDQKVQFLIVTRDYTTEYIDLLWDNDFSRIILQNGDGSLNYINSNNHTSQTITLSDILQSMGFSFESIMTAGVTFRQFGLIPYVWDNYLDTPIKDVECSQFTINW